MATKPSVHVLHYPTYRSARMFLSLMEGQSRRTLFDMRATIDSQRGTPQDTRTWANPDEWIPEVLEGEERRLAEHLWRGSRGLVNPRHLTGVWSLCSSYELLVQDDSGRLQITSAGRDFLENPFGETERQLDYGEGLLHLLAIVAEHGPGRRADLLPPFTEFLARCSRVLAQSAIRGAWYERIINLVNRQLVMREAVTYQITEAGLDYLEAVAPLLEEKELPPVSRTTTALRRLLDEQQKEVRDRIAETLRTIDPYQLENVISTLLEAMGYENVVVTKRSGDGGIDVVGDIRVGITYVREVVQVKRHHGTIQRPVLDQLRGSLHRFNANRGTIITTGGFSKGAKDAAFEERAAPITLIDGDTLITLLIEHEIGARKETISVTRFEPDDFKPEEEPADAES